MSEFKYKRYEFKRFRSITITNVFICEWLYDTDEEYRMKWKEIFFKDIFGITEDDFYHNNGCYSTVNNMTETYIRFLINSTSGKLLFKFWFNRDKYDYNNWYDDYNILSYHEDLFMSYFNPEKMKEKKMYYKLPESKIHIWMTKEIIDSEVNYLKSCSTNSTYYKFRFEKIECNYLIFPFIKDYYYYIEHHNEFTEYLNKFMICSLKIFLSYYIKYTSEFIGRTNLFLLNEEGRKFYYYYMYNNNAFSFKDKRNLHLLCQAFDFNYDEWFQPELLTLETMNIFKEYLNHKSSWKMVATYRILKEKKE